MGDIIARRQRACSILMGNVRLRSYASWARPSSSHEAVVIQAGAKPLPVPSQQFEEVVEILRIREDRLTVVSAAEDMKGVAVGQL
jgi:hypothetical protein